MRRVLVSAAAASGAVVGLLAVASPAQAAPAPPVVATPNQVWVQEYQRASSDATCDDPPAALDIPWQSDWDPAEMTWTPSWAQWPNGGEGGWVCTRSITWAQGTYHQYLT